MIRLLTWIKRETKNGRKFAVVYEHHELLGLMCHLREITHTTIHVVKGDKSTGSYDAIPLGTGMTPETAFLDAIRRGKIVT